MVFWGLLNWGWSSIGSPFSGKQVVSDFSYFRRRKQSVTKLWVPFKGQIQILRVDWKGKATFFFRRLATWGEGWLVSKNQFWRFCSTMKSSQVSQMIKNLPSVLETHVWLLGQKDTLEKGMKTHSSMLAWRIPWTEEPGGLQSMGVAKGQIWLSD